MRKAVILTLKGCFRPIKNHPFLMCMLLLLMLLYRSSPLAFSLLVYISPVVVSTGVLLGTLLSFGHMNIDERQVPEKTTLCSRAGIFGEANVFEKDVSYPFERRMGEEGNVMEELRLAAGKIVSVDRHCSLDDTVALIKGRSRETDLDDFRHKGKYGMVEEQFGGREANFSVPKVSHLGSDFDRSEIDSYDPKIVSIDSMESRPPSPWKKTEILEEDVDGAIDDLSDRVQSSSPDAWMSDFLPLLDELHPLLDEDASQLLPQGSHADLKHFPTSGIRVLDDETDNNQELDVVEDNEEEEEDEEHVDKKEQTKSAITWTEEDEKNLMDLGSSEIERNQRLESLMERRKSRKYMSMELDKNLIDFESSDTPNNIAPISTVRQNPFEIPHDSYDTDGLPPVPGSAPSILVPGRNPFAIPYEERSNILGDGLQPRERFFRHESFNVGPSIFAASRQDERFRPYFFPERSIFDDLCYPPSHQHSNESSDSKISSILDTESFNSAEDLDHLELIEDDIYSEPESTSKIVNVMEKVIIEDITHEPEAISKNVDHGSRYHEESLKGKSNERREVDKLETELAGAKSICEEGETLPSVENRFSKGPSTSPTSEMRRIFFEIVTGGLTFEETTGGAAGELDKPNEGIDLSVSSAVVDDIPHSEPVYDSSPPHVSKNNSSSSISSNVHVESDMNLLPLLIKKVVPERESERSNRETKNGTPTSIEMPTASSKPPLNNDAPGPTNVEVRRTEDHKNVHNGSVENHAVSSSRNDPSLVNSEGKQGTSSELHVAEQSPSAPVSLGPKQGKLEKEDNLTSKEESTQMKADKVGSPEEVDQRSVEVVAENPESGAAKAEGLSKTTSHEGQEEDSDKTNSSWFTFKSFW